MRFTTQYDLCSGLHLSLCTGLMWRQEVMGVGWGQWSRETIGTSFAQLTSVWGTVSPLGLQGQGRRGALGRLTSCIWKFFAEGGDSCQLCPTALELGLKMNGGYTGPRGVGSFKSVPGDEERNATLQTPTPSARVFPAWTGVDVSGVDPKA